MVQFNDFFSTDKLKKSLFELFSDMYTVQNQIYTKQAIVHLTDKFPNSKLFLTHSATGALEVIARLLNLQKGDEILLQSFTYVSTVNAFVSFGATPVFVDINDKDFNIDLNNIEHRITNKTKAIVVTHYAGRSTEMDVLKNICDKRGILLIEDAAMSYGNQFQNRFLGSIGDFGVISFDYTKQISAIQGGVLLVNNKDFFERADYIINNGTNRSSFESQKTSYFEWIDIGSKYKLPENNALILLHHLENEDKILGKRKLISSWYFNELKMYEEKIINVKEVNTNYNLFYFLTNSLKERDLLRLFLHENGVETKFHYIPLHNSTMGLKFGEEVLSVTENVSNCLLRLPFHHNLTQQEISKVCELIKFFYASK